MSICESKFPFQLVANHRFKIDALSFRKKFVGLKLLSTFGFSFLFFFGSLQLDLPIILIAERVVDKTRKPTTSKV